jgi:hypothetical protein
MSENWKQREIEKVEQILKDKIREVNRIGLVAYIQSLGENNEQNITSKK